MVRIQPYIFTQNSTLGIQLHVFGPAYWPSSGCTVNSTSSYTICACLTLVGGMPPTNVRRDLFPPRAPHAHIV